MNYKIKLHQSLLLCPGHKAVVQADIELVKTHRPLLLSAGGRALAPFLPGSFLFSQHCCGRVYPCGMFEASLSQSLSHSQTFSIRSHFLLPGYNFFFQRKLEISSGLSALPSRYGLKRIKYTNWLYIHTHRSTKYRYIKYHCS